MSNKSVILNEIAVKSRNDDLLSYYPFAEKIKEIIQGYASNPEPLTIGIYGKWGAGKTSLLNLIEKNIEIFQKNKEDKPYIKFHYNPWLYQTKDEMLFDFFYTLSNKLKFQKNQSLQKAGKLILKYSRYLKSIKLSVSGGIPKTFNAGLKIEPHEIFKALGEDLQGAQKSIDELKNEVNDELASSDKKVIIFIDDIDRLDREEIYTLLKLIKINADFKNLVFILCLDPEHVAKAIHGRYGPDVKSGKDFLEKIINIPLELPLVEKADLDLYIRKKLNSVIGKRLIREDLLEELNRSLNVSYFDSPREVIRILNSFSISLYAIGDEVNIHDLFWVEYLKLKYPKAYEVLKTYGKDNVASHVFNPVITLNNDVSEIKSESGKRLVLKKEHPEAYKIIDFVFPMDRTNTVSAYQSKGLKPATELDKGLRINHISHFEKYFSYHTKGKVSEIEFSTFKSFLQDNDEENASESLEKILSNSNEYKVVYRLSAELDEINKQDYGKFISFLIKNIDQFKEEIDGHLNSIELIQNIGEKLRENHSNVSSETAINIAENMNYFQLSYFVGRLQENPSISYLEDLELILIDKVKLDQPEPFYTKREVSKLIMETWSRRNNKEFQEFLNKSLSSKENVFSFLQCFPYLWNNHIQGVFKHEDFVFIKEQLKINVDIIFNKIKDFVFQEFNLESLERDFKKWDDKRKNTKMDNVNQFVYWYLKDKQVT